MLRPSSNWSCIKSIDHTWFMASGTVKVSAVNEPRLHKISDTLLGFKTPAEVFEQALH